MFREVRKLYIQTDFMMKWSKIIKKKEKRGKFFTGE